MNAEELKLYIALTVHFEMKDKYIQETIQQLQGVAEELAIPQEIKKNPMWNTNNTSIKYSYMEALKDNAFSWFFWFFDGNASGRGILLLLIVAFLVVIVWQGWFWLLLVLGILLILGILIYAKKEQSNTIVTRTQMQQNCKKDEEEYYLKLKAEPLRMAKETKQKQIVLRDLNRFKDMQKIIKNVLVRLYGLNVIHPKYRDVLAMSYFHHYLDSGRCTSLEGVDGAYNLYEKEKQPRVSYTLLSDTSQIPQDILWRQDLLCKAEFYGATSMGIVETTICMYSVREDNALTVELVESDRAKQYRKEFVEQTEQAMQFLARHEGGKKQDAKQEI